MYKSRRVEACSRSRTGSVFGQGLYNIHVAHLQPTSVVLGMDGLPACSTVYPEPRDPQLRAQCRSKLGYLTVGASTTTNIMVPKFTIQPQHHTRQVHSSKLTWKWRGALYKTTILYIGPSMDIPC